jgi:serine/threonine-protein kinase ATR
LSEAKVDKKREKDVSVARDFSFVNRAFPSTMIVPLQDAITPTLPAGPDTLMGHNPFPLPVVTIESE